VAEPIAAQRDEVTSGDRNSKIVLSVAAVLPLAGMFLIGAGIAAAIGMSGARVSDRLAYGTMRFTGAFTASFALAAATLLAISVPRHDRRERWTTTTSAVVAVVVICAAIYFLLYLIAVHAQSLTDPPPSNLAGFVYRTQYQTWGARLTDGLVAGAGIVIAATTLVVLRRPFRTAEPQPTAEP
jgi:NO-binding membrane sensor protein with MHYT domain